MSGKWKDHVFMGIIRLKLRESIESTLSSIRASKLFYLSP